MFIRLCYIKNHYKLAVVNLRRQKELDADPKAIEQTEFVRQLKNSDGIILTTRRTTEIRNAFANKMSTDIKLSKTQVPKIIRWIFWYLVR